MMKLLSRILCRALEVTYVFCRCQEERVKVKKVQLNYDGCLRANISYYVQFKKANTSALSVCLNFVIVFVFFFKSPAPQMH
jgi:hypothetical protein